MRKTAHGQQRRVVVIVHAAIVAMINSTLVLALVAGQALVPSVPEAARVSPLFFIGVGARKGRGRGGSLHRTRTCTRTCTGSRTGILCGLIFALVHAAAESSFAATAAAAVIERETFHHRSGCESRNRRHRR